MTDAVIVSACRTAIGTALKGSLVDVDPLDLGTEVVAAALARSGIPADEVDDVILGESLAGGGDIARYAAIQAGLTGVAGGAVNRHCASGLAALNGGAASVMAGMEQVVITGGVHSTSLMPQSRRRVPGTDDVQTWMSPSHPDTPDAPNMDMSITVGMERSSFGRGDPRSDGRLGAALPRKGDCGYRRGSVRRGDHPTQGRPAGRNGDHLRDGRASPPDHVDGEARRTPTAPPGDRRLLDHRWELRRDQRRCRGDDRCLR